MLREIRNQAKSWVVKVLFGLLVLSFALWGVGDMFGPSYSGSSIFEVGDIKVEPADMESTVRRELDRLRPVLGSTFGVDQARSMGILEAVLQREINDTALYLAATKLGVIISDDMVRDEIHANPTFQGLGGFDRERFQRAVFNSYLTEGSYIGLVRKQLGREQLLTSLSNAQAPKTLVDALFRHRQEKRIADTLEITDAGQPEPADPDEATVRKYHLDNAVHFTAPEYRALTVVRLDAADLAAEVQVTDAHLRQAYDARLDEFVTPERRQLRQIVVNSEADANKAKAAIGEGREFAHVAKEIAGMDPAAVELGTVTRQELLPELAEAAFALKAGETSAPVKTPLGWHLINAVSIDAGGTKTFEAARDGLKKAIAHEKAVDSLFELANRLEDNLGGGATVVEAANQLNLKIVKIAAIDANGLDAGGRPVPGLPGGDFLNVAFATDEGADSPLTETGSDGYFILHVDGVTPPVLRPLETVKAEVVAAWKAEQRLAAAKKAADAVVGRVGSGTDLKTIAAERGLAVNTTAPFARQPEGDGPGLPPEMIGGIFDSRVGEAAVARTATGFMVAQLREIVPADPVLDKDGVDALSKRLSGAIEQDILVQLAGALRDQYGVSVNRQAVDELLAGRGGGQGRGRGR